jgi:hypothetical protein
VATDDVAPVLGICLVRCLGLSCGSLNLGGSLGGSRSVVLLDRLLVGSDRTTSAG